MGDFGISTPAGDFGTGVATERMESREKLRSNAPIGNEFPVSVFNEVLSARVTTNVKTSGNSSDASVRSFTFVGSPVPGNDDYVNISDNNSGRLNNRKASSRVTGTGLEALHEDNAWIHDAAEHNMPKSKMPRRSNYGPTPDNEILVETGTTQTQPHVTDEEAEIKTNNIATQLKTYFETLGAPQTESLNQLAHGMNRKQAARLFYQTCVNQTLAYEDISLSKGAKM